MRVLELPANWAVGQRAEVYIETARRNETGLLPAKAVAWREGISGVFVGRDQKAAWIPVTLGLSNREQVEVVEGLSIGEPVLLPTDAARPTIEGRKVSIR